MTDIRYKQPNPEDKLIEECAELIQALCKFKNFGPQITDPITGVYYNNLLQIKSEIADVECAIARLQNSWSEIE